jgi:hypothetical protein
LFPSLNILEARRFHNEATDVPSDASHNGHRSFDVGLNHVETLALAALGSYLGLTFKARKRLEMTSPRC